MEWQGNKLTDHGAMVLCFTRGSEGCRQRHNCSPLRPRARVTRGRACKMFSTIHHTPTALTALPAGDSIESSLEHCVLACVTHNTNLVRSGKQNKWHSSDIAHLPTYTAWGSFKQLFLGFLWPENGQHIRHSADGLQAQPKLCQQLHISCHCSNSMKAGKLFLPSGCHCSLACLCGMH